jgi:Apea-like HEPN
MVCVADASTPSGGGECYGIEFNEGRRMRETHSTAPVTLLTCFRKLILSDRISGHIELMPGVNITNDPDVKKHFFTSQWRAAVGLIESTHFEDESSLVFGEYEMNDMRGLEPERFLLVVLIWLDALLRDAWLIMDHAMECDAAFLRVETPIGSSWTRNYLAGRPSFADGRTDQSIVMSADEPRRWSQVTDVLGTYLSASASISIRFMMEKGYVRTGRALEFVAAARRAPDLAFKIAHYCSALETLFTTESTELAHKLSERVAFFLAARGHKPHGVFTTIKNAYNVRSKLVHGDTLKQSQIDGLPELSSQCDLFLREILWDISSKRELQEVFDSHNETVERYFTELILGQAAVV